MLKVFSKFLFWLVLFILFSVVAVLFFSIQTQPKIINTSVVDARSAQHANCFLKRLKYSFNPSQQINSLVIKSSELTALNAILTRSEERLVTNADIEKNKLILVAVNNMV